MCRLINLSCSLTARHPRELASQLPATIWPWGNFVSIPALRIELQLMIEEENERKSERFKEFGEMSTIGNNTLRCNVNWSAKKSTIETRISGRRSHGESLPEDVEHSSVIRASRARLRILRSLEWSREVGAKCYSWNVSSASANEIVSVACRIDSSNITRNI